MIPRVVYDIEIIFDINSDDIKTIRLIFNQNSLTFLLTCLNKMISVHYKIEPVIVDPKIIFIHKKFALSFAEFQIETGLENETK